MMQKKKNDPVDLEESENELLTGSILQLVSTFVFSA